METSTRALMEAKATQPVIENVESRQCKHETITEAEDSSATDGSPKTLFKRTHCRLETALHTSERDDRVALGAVGDERVGRIELVKLVHDSHSGKLLLEFLTLLVSASNLDQLLADGTGNVRRFFRQALACNSIAIPPFT